MQTAADAREGMHWGPVSHLMALIANIKRDPKRKATPYQPWDFWHPRGVKKPPSGMRLTPDALRAIGPAIAGGGR